VRRPPTRLLGVLRPVPHRFAVLRPVRHRRAVRLLVRLPLGGPTREELPTGVLRRVPMAVVA
jgi:hypothetical protein